MRQLDLFAGIGGISLAAEWAGIETVAFCEKEPFAQDVLRRRFPGRPIYDDVFNLNREVLERDGIIGGGLPEIDIVAGGFPCQPFSHAGKRAGTADDRYLWPEMRRIIGELRPSWVFAENVDGLVSMAQSDWDLVMEDEATICEEAEMVIETIRKDFEDLGYESIPIIVPACGVGASHRRYRILVLGNTERSGCLGDERRRSDKEPKDGCADVADTENRRQPEFQERDHRCEEQRNAQERHGAGASSRGSSRHTPEGARELGGTSAEVQEIMADSDGRECEKRMPGGLSKDKKEVGARLDIRFAGHRSASESLADATSGRFRETGQHFERSAQRFANSGWPGSAGTTQPGMGGSPYELSDWLDGWGMNPLDAIINFIASYPQPALMGQEQYAWEPPRVATGVKNRAARLKALGNAVDPLQALPVLYGIRVMHEHMQKGGRLL